MRNVWVYGFQTMFKSPKYLLGAAFLVLSVFVDFTSTLLSVASDALLVGAGVYLITAYITDSDKKES